MRRAFAEGRRPYVAAFLFALAVVVLRRPDALLNAQFWAEDGAIWYRHAHEFGALRPFLMTQDGYFSTYLRLVGLAAQALPLALAPLFMNGVAFVLQAVPAAFLLSPRFKDAIPDFRARLALAAAYLLLPNTAEIHGNATNAQWYLALIAFMIVVARPPSTRGGNAVDVATLALAGLSGPYAVFLAPLAYLRWRKENDGRRLRQLLVLAVTGALQLMALFALNAGSRFGYRPEFSLALLVGMIEKQILLGGLVGMRGYRMLANHDLLPHLISLAAVATIAYAAVRGSWQLRYLLAFAGASFAASLIAPNIGRTAGAADYAARAWSVLFSSSSGSRYWFLPVLALVTSALWAATRKKARITRAIGVVTLCIAAFGFAADFRDPPLPDLGFIRHAATFDALSRGETATIPLNPPGWEMTLTKK